MARILYGAPAAEEICNDLKDRIAVLNEKNISPALAVVRVGEKPDDIAYERGLTKRADKAGVKVSRVILPQDADQQTVIDKINELNEDRNIHGVLIFCPLPAGLDEDRIRNTLIPEKDMDGITDISEAGVYTGSGKGYPPCTAAACMEVLKYYSIPVEGRRAVVIGRSRVIGKPAAMMLLKSNATVTICHTKTVDTGTIVSESDILITAAGHMGTVKSEYLSKGQTVIDVSVNFDENGRMCGDVDDFERASQIVDAITPVPKGVGSVTTSILMQHVVEAAEKTVS